MLQATGAKQWSACDVSHTGLITKFENTSNANIVRAAAIEVDDDVETTAWTVNNFLSRWLKLGSSRRGVL